MNIRIVILLFVISSGFGVFSQNQLSSLDAINFALKSNRNINNAKYLTSIDSIKNTWANTGLFPSIDFTIGNNNVIQDNTGNPFTFTPGVILSQSISPSINSVWNLGPANFYSKRNLEKTQQRTSQNELLIIESTILDALLLYYKVISQKKILKCFNDLKTFSNELMNFHLIKEKNATSSSLDLLQFKNQFFSDSMNVLLQEVNYKNAIRNLCLLMNDTASISNNKLPFLTDGFPTKYSLPLLKSAIDNIDKNNEVVKQNIAIDIQSNALKLNESFWFPTVNFQFGVSPSRSWFRDLDNPSFKMDTKVLNYYANVNVRYNLYNNWNTQRSIKIAKIQKEILELDASQLKLNLKTSLNNYYSLFKMRSSLLDVSAKNLEFASKSFLLAQKKYNQGVLSSIDLLIFKNNLQNAQLKYIESEYNKLEIYLQIKRLTGDLLLDYN
tara:strand:+ start:1859 stop:3181 length:1323 start_codon:yes stop_codon:yes gene_type:complete